MARYKLSGREYIVLVVYAVGSDSDTGLAKDSRSVLKGGSVWYEEEEALGPGKDIAESDKYIRKEASIYQTLGQHDHILSYVISASRPALLMAQVRCRKHGRYAWNDLTSAASETRSSIPLRTLLASQTGSAWHTSSPKVSHISTIMRLSGATSTRTKWTPTLGTGTDVRTATAPPPTRITPSCTIPEP